MHKLCHVKILKRAARVGDYLATNGAFNRKYRVAAINEVPAKEGPVEGMKCFAVEIEVLGSFYASGREVPAKKARRREFIVCTSELDKYEIRPYGYHIVTPAREK